MLGVRSFYSQHRNETKISIQTGINSWQNGFRFTIYSGVDNSFSGVGSDRADFTGRNISQAILGDRSHGQMVNQYFNTSLFTVNAIGTYGKSPRIVLANPDLFNIDMAGIKYFPINERMKFQFRAAFFNRLNNVNFTVPVLGSANPDQSAGHRAAAKLKIPDFRLDLRDQHAMNFASQFHLGMDLDIATAFADKEENKTAISQRHSANGQCCIEYQPPVQMTDIGSSHLLGYWREPQNLAKDDHLHRDDKDDEFHRTSPKQNAKGGIHDGEGPKRHHTDQISGGGLTPHTRHIQG
jgi:hypothetical protein